MTEIQKPKHKRSLRNLRFMEGSQLRLTFGAMTIGLLASTFLLWNVMAMVGRSLDQVKATDPAMADLVSQIHSAIRNVLAIGLVCNLASAVMALVFGLMIGHRFYGPVVPLTRHLKELKEGKYSARVRLRNGDELVPLMNAQNELAEALEKKSGKS